jgi:hypothetical protein
MAEYGLTVTFDPSWLSVVAVEPAVSILSPGVTEAERVTSVPFNVTFPDAYSMVLPVSAIITAAGVSNIITMLSIFVAKQIRIIWLASKPNFILNPT